MANRWLTFPCPECGGSHTAASGGWPSKGWGGHVRHRVCRTCGHKFRTLQKTGGKETVIKGKIVSLERGCNFCPHRTACRGLAPAEPVMCEVLLPSEVGLEVADSRLVA